MSAANITPMRPDGAVLKVLVRIDRIRLDPRTQPRNHIDHEVAERYRDAMGEGAEFPPVTVFYDGEDYWLADGWHRVTAARLLDWSEIVAEVRPGGLRDAEWHSFSVNATHGYPRDRKDVERILHRIFRDPEWSGTPVRAITDHTHIAKSTVFRHRERFLYKPEPPPPKASATVSHAGQDCEAETETQPVWRQTDIEDFTSPPAEVPRPERDPRFAFQAFPPDHAAPAMGIRQHIKMLNEALTLEPQQFMRAMPWLDRAEVMEETAAVARWIEELRTLIKEVATV